LDAAAFLPYSSYYLSHQALEAMNGLPCLLQPLTIPGRTLLYPLEISGLGTDALIDVVKGATVSDESVGDEGYRGYLNPFHEFVPGPLRGPRTYLPGIHRDGTIDLFP
jgi:hypothetical protein